MVGLVGMLIVWGALAARVFALPMGDTQRFVYVTGFAAFLAIEVLLLVRPPRSTPVLLVGLAVQTAVVLAMLAVNPDRDFVTVLFVIQSYEAATALEGRIRLATVSLLILLIGVSLALELGIVRGLALGLVPMAAGVAVSTYAVVTEELELSRRESERMVADVRSAQRQLELNAGQVEELAAIEERARVAQHLEESVSETLTELVRVNASVREQLLSNPDVASRQLGVVRDLAQDALSQMRCVIEELRPPVVGEGTTSR